MDIDSTYLGQIGHRVYRTAYRFRQVVAYSVYLSASAVAYALAYFIRFELRWPIGYNRVFLLSLPMLLGLRLLFDMIAGLSMGRWRFISTRDVFRLVVATGLGSLAFLLLSRALLEGPVVPRSVIFLEGLFTVLFVAGTWIAYRTGYEMLRHHRAGFNGSARRVLIVGAGEAGNLLAREMRRFPTGFRPVGFVDDDPNKRGMQLQGLRVMGHVDELPALAREAEAQEIIIAAPTASPAELRRIVEACEPTSLPFKVLPGIQEVLDGQIRLAQLRDVQIEDLLGREPVQLTLPELAAELSGRTVLITGAAGSIGSELARQVALHGPACLVLLDQAETPLFYLEMELHEQYSGLNLVSVVGDITDAETVERVFAERRPDRIFHAAAYKHVPMMETNRREAVRNNVLGTWRVADAAGRHGAAKFVLVSTDKAVRPVSVMGATKRLAEVVVLELQEQYRATAFAAVRFGNVLGSAGSVLPIFKRQLEQGRQLTVTHPDVTRYFMTIPEAVQLILVASLMPEVRGHIAMLEMGQPVKILDLARNLLDLSGIRHGDGRIVYTGLRPGERLHEELVAPDEITEETAHPKVRVVRSLNGQVRHVAPLVAELGNGAAAAARADLDAMLEEIRIAAEPASR